MHSVSLKFLVGILSFSDYYPFGMQMGGRNDPGDGYRYGFNGMEKDDEVKGSGNSYDFGARMYDSRLGRWLSIDPLSGSNSHISTYCGMENSPIALADPDGKDAEITITENTITVHTTIFIYGAGASETEAGRMEKFIGDYWNVNHETGKNFQYTDEFGKVFDVVFDTRVELLYPDDPTADPIFDPLDAFDPWTRNNYIRLTPEPQRSHVKLGDEGTWSTEKGWTYAHEFGHLLNLMDRYENPWFWEEAGTTSVKGWEGNMMAETWGLVDQRNIDSVVEDAVGEFNTALKSIDEHAKAGGGYLDDKTVQYMGLGTYKTEIDAEFNWNQK
jgi:RHS repeat-associated protein